MVTLLAPFRAPTLPVLKIRPKFLKPGGSGPRCAARHIKHDKGVGRAIPFPSQVLGGPGRPQVRKVIEASAPKEPTALLVFDRVS